VRIVLDDLSGPEIAAFLEEHLREMRSVTPPESKHALDLDGLRQPGVAFWTVWDGAALVGCGALQRLDDGHAEIKSMRTRATRRRSGVGSLLLGHLVAEARRAGYRRLSLETGSADFYLPARRLYEKHGFEPCGPFAGYRPDPNSVYLTLGL
jgi:putative acetyltransferase